MIGPWKIVASVFRPSGFAGLVGTARNGGDVLPEPSDGISSGRGMEAKTWRSAADGGELCHLDNGMFKIFSRREMTVSME